MKTKLITALIFLIFHSTYVLAARPSITSLQQQINQLQAEVIELTTVSDQQETRITYLESLPKLPVVVDSKSNVVGTTLGTRLDDAGGLNWFNAELLLFAYNQAFVVKIARNNFNDLATVYFSDANCNGIAFLEVMNSATGVILPQGGLYRPHIYGPTDTSQEVAFNYSSQSGWNGNDYVCFNSVGNDVGYPAAPALDVSGFAPPFHVEWPQ